MEFNSLGFLLFYTMFFAAYWSLKSSMRWQNILLLISSYIFYGWWDWRFTGLIMLTTLTSWGTALMAERGHRLGWTALNIILNIGMLIVFKYLDFFGEGLVRLAGIWGWNIDTFTVDILLPIGISFYTFQAISYSIDVYRGELAATRDFTTFATFIAFFPQLLAGPIERGRQLLPQISSQRRWDYTLAVDGIRETLWGLFKKVAVADMCGIYVDRIYSNPDASAIRLSVAAVLFVLQIYCDFSGYCNMARGLAAMLGIRLMVNFRYPLFSRNPADFWHRWHISLMTWFRDYVYIPAGGSRSGLIITCRNILIVFLLSGIWHGASVNYLIWGGIWGLIMIATRITGQRRYSPKSVAANTPGDLLKIATMGYLLTLTFIVFRIHDIPAALNILERVWWVLLLAAALSWGGVLLCRLSAYWTYISTVSAVIILITLVWVAISPGQALACVVAGVFPASIAGMLTAEWWGRRRAFALERMPMRHRSIRLLIYWILIFAILLSNSSGQQFIYYQF